MNELIFALSELNEVAKKFLYLTKQYKTIAFNGQMGAGKTTFIAALCKHLQVEDYVSSPTFSIVNEYHSPALKSVFHFDFYRIDDPIELLNIGITEYFDDSAYCFIEWPEIGRPFLPDETLHVNIETLDNGQRKISWG